VKIKSCISLKQEFIKKSSQTKKGRNIMSSFQQTPGKTPIGLLEMTMSLPLCNDGVNDYSFTLNGPDFPIG
jgi:hypothetical protein